MKANLFLLIILLILHNTSFEQTINACGCGGKRYIDKIFPSTIKTTVKYGQNLNGGAIEELFMDVYEPENDTICKRPVVILAHGGGFASGNKIEMNDLCKEFAQRGFIAATIDYRLIPPGTTIDNTKFTEAIVKAMQDMKAAVRYFRHDSKTSNTFNVDTSFILVGGYSAGAVTALHTAYMSKSDNSALGVAFINGIVSSQGGLEGQSNNFFDVSSQVQGVINHSGAILNKDWIQSTEPPIVSYHGSNDDVVPIGTGLAGGIITMDGSQKIHQKASQIGISNYLYVVNGGGHTNIFGGSEYYTYLNNAFLFLNQKVLCKQVTSVSSNLSDYKIKVFPNPASNSLTINYDGIEYTVK